MLAEKEVLLQIFAAEEERAMKISLHLPSESKTLNDDNSVGMVPVKLQLDKSNEFKFSIPAISDGMVPTRPGFPLKSKVRIPFKWRSIWPGSVPCKLFLGKENSEK